MSWQQEAEALFLEGCYDQVANLYEQAIQTEPDAISHYWHLGLVYLLQGHEEEAQATWMVGMSQSTDETGERWLQELVQILDTEAQRQADLGDYETAWLIRQHLRELAPDEVNNLLHLIQLSLNLGSFTPDIFEEFQVVGFLGQCSSATVNSELLLAVMRQSIEFSSAETLAFFEACLAHVHEPDEDEFVGTALAMAFKLCYQANQPIFAASIAELCLKFYPEYPAALQHLCGFYTNAGRHQQAIEVAKRYYSNCETVDWQIVGSYLILRSLMSAGAWSEIEPMYQRHQLLLSQMIQEPIEKLDTIAAHYLAIVPFFAPYIQDNPQENRWFQNQAAQLFQKKVSVDVPTAVPLYYPHLENKSRPLRIGYIGHTFRIHSVGWLSRWLFQYHDRELFQTAIYCVNQNLEDLFSQTWFKDRVNIAHRFGVDTSSIAAQIAADKIDILVDLDSITMDSTCKVMAMKPAPVQVTWLGWDASGLPAIDYFIADPYVLPENAQDYYQENIWRLPQTYVAVDGFEVGTPTLRREHLEIPSNAVVYLSAQKGFKRHPDTIRLQMQIIKEVPNSYFLIKGAADELTIQQFFKQLASEVGVDTERLRFLPTDPHELVHRANLAIADVVLDTYPYNGATTTLETLWMGIPLVTKVGQQFAARNSYAFMMNVGVTEGIAWTDEGYVEWAVRLGMDEALRWKVAGKLKASRHTSPLWNAKQFTREMEKAYQQMWIKYLESR
ncbi:MAG: O-linked N-acetylglucosamine transferase, SPINDLY family protein [Aphanothece sp. CMT-3BRIN-NPC111]|nr:O-linked N-acetylglucosamine transferase, SPINDLY family protein [Aphanothece sp. CMT-3BRIN-NPC111]